MLLRYEKRQGGEPRGTGRRVLLHHEPVCLHAEQHGWFPQHSRGMPPQPGEASALCVVQFCLWPE